MLIKNEVHDFIVKVDIMLFPKKNTSFFDESRGQTKGGNKND